uniref:ACT domain-containing protein ACR n=1 Tax=Anthurium amnicola TaxID=1678845 RepID=A0A1D1YMT6_9ARAE
MERRPCWPYFDPEYENFSQRINPPRVCVDNTSCSDCTLIKVDSVNRPGILLEVVQVLSDLDLAISKAYISSDGGWFMDVFHATDQQGRKISDRKTIEYIEMALGPKSNTLSRNSNAWPLKTVGMHSIGDYTAIELIGADRPGLLSEIFAVLANLHCNVLAAEVWTHNMRVACVVYVNDGASCSALDDPDRLRIVEEQLKNVLRVRGDDHREAQTNFPMGYTHVDRRLHQLMFADKDYERDVGEEQQKDISYSKTVISIDQCEDKGYSVVNVRCKDRTKLLFDIVCTLTDMQYVVFHASISSEGPNAVQEYFIRHRDGCTLESKEEKERVAKCLEAAIHRRTSEGIRLELCGRDRVGLLSDVTRVLRENGLSVARAGITTVGEQGVHVFYVRDASGNPVDTKTIEALRREIGQSVMLNVKRVPNIAEAPQSNGWPKTSFSFGSFFERFLT